MSIAATARAAALQAFQAAGDAKEKIRLRLGPSEGDYDPESDVTTTTWEQDTADIDSLPYADKDMKKAVPMSTSTRSFVVLGISVTAQAINQEGEIVDAAGITWQIQTAESDPTKAVFIFHCTA